jgi:hypothetical protein
MGEGGRVKVDEYAVGRGTSSEKLLGLTTVVRGKQGRGAWTGKSSPRQVYSLVYYMGGEGDYRYVCNVQSVVQGSIDPSDGTRPREARLPWTPCPETCRAHC